MKKEIDFSKGKRVSKDRVWPNPKVLISLRLDPKDLLGLRLESERLGIPYQTLINSILHRFVTGELVDKKEAKKIAAS